VRPGNVESSFLIFLHLFSLRLAALDSSNDEAANTFWLRLLLASLLS